MALKRSLSVELTEEINEAASFSKLKDMWQPLFAASGPFHDTNELFGSKLPLLKKYVDFLVDKQNLEEWAQDLNLPIDPIVDEILTEIKEEISKTIH